MDTRIMTRIAKGTSIAVMITVLTLFIFSCILTFTNVAENTITPIIIVISAISILIGSTICTRKASKNGMLQGAVVGFLYIFSIYLISSLTGSGFAISMDTMIMIIASVVAGIVGGIIGINMK